MNEGNGRMSTMKEGSKEGRKEGTTNYRRLRNELKTATDNAKKEYLDSICDEIIEFQRTGCYDLMYMKTKDLGWKENNGIQNMGIEDSREYDNRSETSTENLGELYYRAL
jgi:hypothetical protein